MGSGHVLKGIGHPQMKIHLYSLKLFQTSTSFFLQWNIEDILKNVDQTQFGHLHI